MRIILGNKNIFNMKIETDGELSSSCPFYCDFAGYCNSDLALTVAL